MQESTRLLSAVKKTAALPCKQCLGGQQFPPFYSYQKNAADLCISSDKHGLASVQKQSRQKTGDCPQMHAMMTKRTNPMLTVQCQHGFKGPRQNYKGQTHDATPTHTHIHIVELLFSTCTSANSVQGSETSVDSVSVRLAVRPGTTSALVKETNKCQRGRQKGKGKPYCAHGARVNHCSRTTDTRCNNGVNYRTHALLHTLSSNNHNQCTM